MGCGRGKIVGNLFSKLNLRTKPLGLDTVRHKDRDKRINFKKIDAISFFKKNNNTFDLILIKQTIHLLKINEIKKLLNFCNLKWDPDCLNFHKNKKTPIQTVSVSQARKPIYKSSINSNIGYSNHLQEMYKILDTH